MVEMKIVETDWNNPDYRYFAEGETRALSALTDPNFKENHTVSANVPWMIDLRTSIRQNDGLCGGWNTWNRRQEGGQRGMKRAVAERAPGEHLCDL